MATTKKKSKVRVRGEVVMKPLADVKPNPWNPNRMTPEMRRSLMAGLEKDGWLSSQALLIWATDEEGNRKDLIIDGEHRWTAATELGLVKGPMVFLDNVSEPEAKALTIKMNQKRGDFVADLLVDVVRDLDLNLGSDDLAMDLGFDDEFVMGLIADDPADLDAGADNRAHKAEGTHVSQAATTTDMRVSGSHVRLVQLFFDTDQNEQFQAAVKKLAAIHDKQNVTETVLAVMLEAASGDGDD